VDYDEALCRSLLDKFYALKDQVEKNILPARLVDYLKTGSVIIANSKTSAKWQMETLGPRSRIRTILAVAN